MMDSGGVTDSSVWGAWPPSFRAVVAFGLCAFAFLIVYFITEWDTIRDEARRERNAKKRWWD